MPTSANIHFSDTFWNRIRVEQKITYKDLSDILNLHPSTISKFFSGAEMPSKERVDILCDFFGVDYETGYDEFCKANNKYYKTEVDNSDLDVDIDSILKDEGYTKVSESVDEPDCTEEQPTHEIPKSLLLELIYGKVPYETFFKFITLVVDGKGNPLEEIYGKVSFEEYETIRSILNDGEYPDSTEEVLFPEQIPVFDKWGNVIGMKKREEN